MPLIQKEDISLSSQLRHPEVGADTAASTGNPIGIYSYREFKGRMQVGTVGHILGNMNVTPLIDVLLTLLVIFMIITPTTPRGETALIPQPPPKNAKPQPNSRSVVLQVITGRGGQPQLEINQQNVTWQDLNGRLIDIYKTRAQKVLFVKADNDVPWQDVAAVIDDAHNAGIDHVGLITAKIEATG